MMNNKIMFKSRLLRIMVSLCCCIVLVLSFCSVMLVPDAIKSHNSRHSNALEQRHEYGKSRRLQQELQIFSKAQQDVTQTSKSYNSSQKQLNINPSHLLSKTTPIYTQKLSEPTALEKSKTNHLKTVKRTNEKSPTQPKIYTCDWSCKIKRFVALKMKVITSYSKRVKVDIDTIPSNWTTAQTDMIEERMRERKRHIKQVCHKYGLDRPSGSYQPNAWEFLINKKHHLVWCSVFKAASSTWFYNFNLLAGYTEHQQMHGFKMPMELARKIYHRPSVAELEKMISSSPSPMTFMISRHPLTRLVSVYRDKFVGTVGFYRQLSKDIIQRYPHLQQKRKPTQSRVRIPSFPSFVQYILDEAALGHKLDEHWAPMYSFCTPCLVDFNVYAKMETLAEDGNYIIFSTGIESFIAPKKINLAHKNPTSSVAESYLCQLNKTQINGLNQLYKLDFEIFQYDMKDFQNCKRSES